MKLYTPVQENRCVHKKPPAIAQTSSRSSPGYMTKTVNNNSNKDVKIIPCTRYELCSVGITYVVF